MTSRQRRRLAALRPHLPTARSVRQHGSSRIRFAQLCGFAMGYSPSAAELVQLVEAFQNQRASRR
jgi:hypothetical protein